MVIVQPFSSRLVVTVRPLASVVVEVALERGPPPELLDFELDETLTEELAEPEPDRTLIELASPDDLPAEADALCLVLTSRPSLVIVTTSQSSRETLVSA